MTSSRRRTITPFGRFADGRPVGDVIPFFDDGVHHLFCLTPPAGTLHFPQRLRTTWRHLRSTNLSDWEQLPDALAPGQPGEPDADGIWTGSVIRAEDGYHIFYTGHRLDGSGPRQSVCHATSPDTVTWTKDPANPILVPDLTHFERKDFRDPFVFWNDDEACYWMLLSARSATSPALGRGVVALSTSPDLRVWSRPQVLHAALLTHCPECPEIFRLGERWILAYSRFTDRRGTVYRHADNPRGPWHAFPHERLDGANWYAAKSLTARGRRIAFGWIPDRNPEPSAQTGGFLWGGDLATPRELVLDQSGAIGIRPAAEFVPTPPGDLDYRLAHISGDWTTDTSNGLTLSVDSRGRLSHCVLDSDPAASAYVVTMQVDATAATSIGVAVRTREHLDRGMAVLCYPAEARIRATDLTASQSEDDGEYELATTEYAPFVDSGLSPSSLRRLPIQIVVRGDAVEAFVGTNCFSYRLAPQAGTSLALIVDDGTATFHHIEGRTLG